MARKWVRRGLGIGLLALIAAGTWAASNWDALQTRLATSRLTNARTDADRAKWAAALAARDDGIPVLTSLCRDSEPPLRRAAAAALAKHLESLPATDSRCSELAANLLEALATDDALALHLPLIVERAGPVHSVKCRDAVSACLKSASPETRVAAIQVASFPHVNLRSEVVALLSAPEADVRRAAMFAVGPTTDEEAVIGDEDLFAWLHDADADVRAICRSALVSRGRTDTEIAHGERLVHPDANERLKLLLELRYDDDVVDAEPWLERMSHDVDPGVRAGAARVMMEINGERMLPAPGWVGRLAESDPSATVRQVAGFYRVGLMKTPDPEIRTAEGP
jgi:hypothetical protein